MPTPEDIRRQQELLATNRRTLQIQLNQRDALGSAYTPPGTINGIDEARKHIRQIKRVLREWNTDVDDHPNDEDFDALELNQRDTSHQPHSLQPPQQDDGILTKLQHDPDASHLSLVDRITDPVVKLLEEHVPMNRDNRLSDASIEIATIEYTSRQSAFLTGTCADIDRLVLEISEATFLSLEVERWLQKVVREGLREVDKLMSWVSCVPDYPVCLSIKSSASQTKRKLTELKKYLIDEDIQYIKTWITIVQVAIRNLNERVLDLRQEVIQTLSQEEDMLIKTLIQTRYSDHRN